MTRNFTLLMVFVYVLLGGNTYAQEQAPLKNFEFTISLNKLKTEQQALDIKNEVRQLPGVKNCELILINYQLTFGCTNHDMNSYSIIDRIKAVVVENGAEIVTINRTEK